MTESNTTDGSTVDDSTSDDSTSDDSTTDDSPERPEARGAFSDDFLAWAHNRATAVAPSRWERATRATVESISDPQIVATLRTDAKGWATAAPDEDATSKDRAVERALSDRVVPIAYVLGRAIVTTTSRRLQWSPSQADALIDEHYWISKNTEYCSEMPGTDFDLLNREAEKLGFGGHTGLLNVATMAHDDALVLAFLEHCRLVEPDRWIQYDASG